MQHTVDVWTAATAVIFLAIGVDAILAAKKLSWAGSAKKLLLSFVAIFWLCSFTGYLPALIPNWPAILSGITHKVLPIAALFFLVGGGFRKIVLELDRPSEPPLPEWYHEFARKLDNVRIKDKTGT